jgi:hypothetical protein
MRERESAHGKSDNPDHDQHQANQGRSFHKVSAFFVWIFLQPRKAGSD